MKPKVGILSLGCPRNLVDSESLLGRLALKGYSIVDLDKAEIALINTCAFIEEAKKESIDAILDLIELKKTGRIKKIIVYGCLSQRYQNALKKELPEIDAFVGKLDLEDSVERYSLTPRHFAYLKICEGCVNACSFCIIPKIKGRFVSLKVDSILRKVEELNGMGVSELNVIGQDITGFGKDLSAGEDLHYLLSKICRKADKIKWIRLLYLNPERLNDKLVNLVNNESKICKYIDLPVQHINDRILKLMNRRVTREEVIKIINKIRLRVPGVALRTSLIVGFPGETDKEFTELLDFMKEFKFERLGAFAYSREEGTLAAGLKGQIPEKVKSERLAQVMSTQRDISEGVNSKFLGKTLEVLVDEEDNGNYLGRTQYDAPEVDGSVYLKTKRKLKCGDFVKVNIVDTLEYDLVGEVE